MHAVPFFGKAVYIDAAVLRGMTHVDAARSVIEANNMKLVNAPWIGKDCNDVVVDPATPP